MFSSTDKAIKVIGDLQSGYFRVAESQLSEDFTSSGFSPETLNKTGFLDLMQFLIDAMPDLSFHMSAIQQKGTLVTMKTPLTATHTGTLVLNPFGAPSLPPTGKKISLPDRSLEIYATPEEVTEINAVSKNGGGSLIEEILETLGTSLPAGIRT